MENNFGLKELYDVTLKATYPIEIDDKEIEEGEVVLRFDRIQIATFDENRNITTANGGYDNRALVWWEEIKDVRVTLTQGVFSKSQLALMTNAKLIQVDKSSLLLDKNEELETDENGHIILQQEFQKPIFIYDKKTGEKITEYNIINAKELALTKPYQEVIVDYKYKYQNKGTILRVGQRLVQGYFSFTGKTRVKDDVTGQVKTGILNIPKLKLMSDLSISLGKDAIPLVGRLNAIAVPVGARGEKRVMDLVFLEDDIDSDM